MMRLAWLTQLVIAIAIGIGIAIVMLVVINDVNKVDSERHSHAPPSTPQSGKAELFLTSDTRHKSTADRVTMTGRSAIDVLAHPSASSLSVFNKNSLPHKQSAVMGVGQAAAMTMEVPVKGEAEAEADADADAEAAPSTGDDHRHSSRETQAAGEPVAQVAVRAEELLMARNVRKLEQEAHEKMQEFARANGAAVSDENGTSEHATTATATTTTFGGTEDMAAAFFERVELSEAAATALRGQPKWLRHRDKRYLIFLDGSSFQMIFDLIIGMVDYSSYLILGITCAVAWELPSKPPSELIDDFKTSIDEATFLIKRNDTVDASGRTRYVDTGGPYQLASYAPPALPGPITVPVAVPMPAPAPAPVYMPMGAPLPAAYYTPPAYAYYGASVGAPAHYPHYSRSGGWAQGYADQAAKWHPAAEPSWRQDNWWQRNGGRVQQEWRSHQRQWGGNPQWSYHNGRRRGRRLHWRPSSSRKVLRAPPRHRIHTVFGKRRRRSDLWSRARSQRDHHGHGDAGDAGYAGYAGDGDGDTDGVADAFDLKWERVHLREHLRTRHKLFRKIEKVYKARGHNGTACVLRALCESGHHDHTRREPQTFITELLRAIFTLPKDIHRIDHPANNSNTKRRRTTDRAEHRCDSLLDGMQSDEMQTHMPQHYREAHGHAGSCADRYPECSHGFFD